MLARTSRQNIVAPPVVLAMATLATVPVDSELENVTANRQVVLSGRDFVAVLPPNTVAGTAVSPAAGAAALDDVQIAAGSTGESF